METSSSEHNRSNFSNMSTATGRYAGILEKSVYKKARNGIFQLFSYIYSVAPNFYWLHTVFSFYRIWQLVAPAFCINFVNAWDHSSIAYKINEIIVLPIFLVPAKSRDTAIPYLLGFYICMIGILFAIIIGSSQYFTLNAKLPKYLPEILIFFFGSFGYILQSIASNYSGELISLLITGKWHMNLAAGIVLEALTILCFISYSWLYLVLISVSLTFQPISLLTVTNKSQSGIYLFTYITTFILGVGSNFDSKISQFFTMGCSLLYLLCGLNIFFEGGFASTNHTVCIAATSVAGFAGLINVTITMFQGKTGSSLFLILYIIVWIIVLISTHFYEMFRKRSHLATLDQIIDDNGLFDQLIKSPSRFASVITTGFENAHPGCINWSICRLASVQWPKNILIWFIYAKYISIYPEETMQLVCIGKSIQQNGLKGGFVKHLIDQISTLVRQREPNLSTTLKEKLNKISKQVQSTKHKLRNVWDMIIQSNVGEMESSIFRTFSSIEQCEAEFNHILRQYPNNRFVARSYSRFAVEVTADIKKFEVWDHSTKLLARGMQCSEDQAHELGLHTYPNLPNSIGNGSTMSKVVSESFEEVSTNDVMSIQDSTDTIGGTSESMASISDTIDSITIPSMNKTKVVRFAILFICVICVILSAILFDHFYLAILSEPLQYIYALTYMRSMVFHLTSFSFEIVFESLPQHPVMQYNDLDNLEFLGSTPYTRGQFKHLISEASELSLIVSELQSYKPGLKLMDKARNLIFSDKFDYRSFPDYGQWVTIKLTPFQAFQEYIRLCSDLSNNYNITQRTLGDPAVQSSFNNMAKMSETISLSLDELTNYMISNHYSMTKIVQIVFYTFLCAMPIVIIASNFILLHMVKKDKTEVYKCLTALPKSAVSTIADRLKILKKDNNSELTSNMDETNKQEENIIKILATADSSSQARMTSGWSNSAGSVVLSICVIIAIYLLSDLFITQSKALYEAAPHINYLMGAFGYQVGSFNGLMIIAADGSGTPIPDIEATKLNNGLKTRSAKSVEFLNKLRYGDKETGVVPFKSFAEGMENAVKTTVCKDLKLTVTPHDVYSCFATEVLYSLFSGFQTTLSTPYFASSGADKFTFQHELYKHLWHIENIHLYNAFYAPLFSDIVPTVVREMNNGMPTMFAISAILIIIAIIAEFVVFYFNNEGEKRLKYTLRLLLHCPPNVILQSPKIMSLLSGNFRGNSSDSTNRDADYYDEIANNLPDGIIVVSDEQQNSVVRFVNNSAFRIFNQTNAIIGRNFGDFFDKENNADFVSSIKLNETNTINDIEYGTGPNEPGIHFTIQVTRMKSETIISFRDITRIVLYNKLIAEERSKSDMLLASILPPNLVKRVQTGETDISFAVQSVTITFIDIVEFTPWCGSLPAETVMRTLNSLFCRFDKILNSKPTMTKIKCIGDCYMAAGGIFNEVNQPAVHAKEVVDFGLMTIDSIQEMNQECNQNLQIRVGVNTGGPIVAGVLGIGKPTFEILGPAINMAQQMEHHGVPMNVHVSRPVYELIYGDTFQVKERGEIEIKNGKVVTYLVTGKRK